MYSAGTESVKSPDGSNHQTSAWSTRGSYLQLQMQHAVPFLVSEVGVWIQPTEDVWTQHILRSQRFIHHRHS
jgi:hypothetical protein